MWYCEAPLETTAQYRSDSLNGNTAVLIPSAGIILGVTLSFESLTLRQMMTTRETVYYHSRKEENTGILLGIKQ